MGDLREDNGIEIKDYLSVALVEEYPPNIDVLERAMEIERGYRNWFIKLSEDERMDVFNPEENKQKGEVYGGKILITSDSFDLCDLSDEDFEEIIFVVGILFSEQGFETRICDYMPTQDEITFGDQLTPRARTFPIFISRREK